MSPLNKVPVAAQTGTIQAAHVQETGATLVEFATPDETVAAVVARAGKDDHWCLVAPLLHDGGSEDLGGTFHEVNAPHWFVLYRILIKLMYLSSSKNLHITAKVLKRMENKGKSYGYFS